MVVFFVLIIEIMMLGGVAGEGVLRLQIRASIVLWLCYLLSRVIAGGHLLRQKRCRKGWLGYGLAPMLVFMALVLVFQHGDWHYLVEFLAAIVAATVVLSFSWVKVAEWLKGKRF